jgi:hypothetical protein
MNRQLSMSMALLFTLSGCLFTKRDLPLATGMSEPIQVAPTPHPTATPPIVPTPGVGLPARWMPEQVLLTLKGTFQAAPSDTNFASRRSEWNQISGGSAPFGDGGPEGDLSLGFAIFSARSATSAQTFNAQNSETNGFCDAAVRGISNTASRAQKIADLSLLLLGENLSTEESTELDALVTLGLAAQGGFQREQDVICTVLVNHPRFLTY